MERANSTELNLAKLDKVTGGRSYFQATTTVVPGTEASQTDHDLVKHTQVWLTTTIISK